MYTFSGIWKVRCRLGVGGGCEYEIDGYPVVSSLGTSSMLYKRSIPLFIFYVLTKIDHLSVFKTVLVAVFPTSPYFFLPKPENMTSFTADP